MANYKQQKPLVDNQKLQISCPWNNLLLLSYQFEANMSLMKYDIFTYLSFNLYMFFSMT